MSPHLKLYRLQRPWGFDTQRWQMFEEAPDFSEPIEGISVLQAPDVKAVEGSVEVSDRSMVLDGIVRYGDSLLIVIETKLAGRGIRRSSEIPQRPRSAGPIRRPRKNRRLARISGDFWLALSKQML